MQVRFDVVSARIAAAYANIPERQGLTEIEAAIRTI